MKEIFTDLYNKVVDFFAKSDKNDSKNVARNRLKLVLMQDRTNLNPRLLERLRGEMIDLLSKYVVMDKELLELNFTPEDDQLALMLSIPVIRAKDEGEIEEAIKAEEAEKEKIAKLLEKLEHSDSDIDNKNDNDENKEEEEEDDDDDDDENNKEINDSEDDIEKEQDNNTLKENRTSEENNNNNNNKTIDSESQKNENEIKDFSQENKPKKKKHKKKKKKQTEEVSTNETKKDIEDKKETPEVEKKDNNEN